LVWLGSRVSKADIIQSFFLLFPLSLSFFRKFNVTVCSIGTICRLSPFKTFFLFLFFSCREVSLFSCFKRRNNGKPFLFPLFGHGRVKIRAEMKEGLVPLPFFVLSFFLVRCRESQHTRSPPFLFLSFLNPVCVERALPSEVYTLGCNCIPFFLPPFLPALVFHLFNVATKKKMVKDALFFFPFFFCRSRALRESVGGPSLLSFFFILSWS